MVYQRVIRPQRPSRCQAQDSQRGRQLGDRGDGKEGIGTQWTCLSIGPQDTRCSTDPSSCARAITMPGTEAVRRISSMVGCMMVCQGIFIGSTSCGFLTQVITGFVVHLFARSQPVL